MRATINGLRYDTDNAKRIGGWDNGTSVTDFSYCCETLYRTPRSGRYFLHGEGGARSRYATSHAGGRSYCSGERIVPLPDERSALEWAQENLSVDEVEAEFGHLIADA